MTTPTLAAAGAPMPPWPDLERIARAIGALLARLGEPIHTAASRRFHVHSNGETNPGRVSLLPSATLPSPTCNAKETTMTTQALTTPFSATSSLWSPFKRAMTSIRNAVLRLGVFVAEQRAIAEMHRLDDRMLRDIGYSRSEISSVVRGIGKDYTRRLNMS